MRASGYITGILAGVAAGAFSLAACAQAVEGAAATGKRTDSSHALADSGISDIIVTAQKRSENVQRVGIAITALGGETMTQLGIQSAQDLPKVTPGLQMEGPGSPINTTFTIRGVGQRDISDQNEGAVVQFVDGAYVSWLGAVGEPLYDIERIEVLKGPQGTLFGRNATGGLINIITAKPSRSLEGYVKAMGGSHDQMGVEGAISGPLTDTLSARVSGYWNRNGAYFSNGSGPDKGGLRQYNVRGQLRWEPASNLRVDLEARANWLGSTETIGLVSSPLILDASGITRKPVSQAEFSTYCQSVFGAGGGGLVAPFPPTGSYLHGNCFESNGSDPYRGDWRSSKGEQNHQAYLATVTWDFSDNVTLTSISDYQRIRKSYDSTPSATAIVGLFDYFTQLRGRQLSQEIRLNGTGPRYRWQVGGFYFDRDDDVFSYVNLFNNPAVLARLGANYSVSSKSYALFGQGEYDLTPTLTAIAGGRWTRDKKHLVNSPFCDPNPAATGMIVPGLDQCAFLGTIVFPGSLQFNGFDGGFTKDNWSFKAQLDYKPTSNLLVYLGVNRGAKSGGFNSGGAAFYDLSRTIYKPEQITSYEAGFKATLFDRRATLNASFFHYDYKNYQSYVSIFGSLQVFNIDATVDGAELELNVRPVEGLTLRTALNYLDTVQKNVPFGSGSRDFHMPGAPKWMASGNIRYEWSLGDVRPSLQASISHVDARSSNAVDLPDFRLPAYTRLDLRAELATLDRDWTIAGFVNNATDRRIQVINVPVPDVSGGSSISYDRPRWYGLSLEHKF